MADKKIGDLDAITVLATGDFLVGVDVSESPDKTVKFTFQSLITSAGTIGLGTPDIGTPSAGVLTNCTGLPVSTGITGLGSNVATFLATPTSANFAAAITNETGTGAVVLATSPSLVTPILGVAAATSLAVPAITTASGALTVTPAAGSNLNVVTSGTGNFAVNTTELVVDAGVGVGIGTAAPSVGTLLHVQDNDASASPQIKIQQSGAGDASVLFNITATTNWNIGVDNDASDAFKIEPSATFGSVFVMTVQGLVGVGIDPPTEKLYVKVGTADAVECLGLEQLDVSEGFVNFKSTSAASTVNPLTSFTAGNTIQGFLRVEINGTDRWIPFYDAPTS